jgi:hybrid cluster-associated redox disulfide protein
MGIELPVTKDTRIADLLIAYPQTGDVFSGHGLGCFVCLGASMETVEEGALMHGLDANEIIEELNRAITPTE